MRLERDDHAPVVGALGRVERRLDLGRVMAVVVDQRDAARLADDREAARDAAEGGERLLGDVERHLELVGDGDGRQAVEHVVRARHAHRELAERSPRR